MNILFFQLKEEIGDMSTNKINYDNYARLIGMRIEEVRYKTGLSQEDFAEKLNITKSRYLEYVKGRNQPKPEFLKLLKETFPLYTDMEYIITGVEGNQEKNDNANVVIESLEIAAKTLEKYKNLIKLDI